MNSKIILTAVIAGSVGFLAGWGARALVKKKNEELIEESTPEEKKVIRVHMDEDEFNRFSTKTSNKLFDSYRGSIFSETEQDAIEEANAEAESPSEKDYEEGNPEEDPDYAEDYSSAPYDPDDDYDDYGHSVEKIYEDDDDDEEAPKVHKKNVWPYEIDADQFEEDNGFSKSTLEYYSNNVLIDEDGEEIHNAGSLIGSGVLKNLLRTKDVAYVRNENLEIDYEIVYIDDRYEGYEEY